MSQEASMDERVPEGWVVEECGIIGTGVDDDPFRPNLPEGLPWAMLSELGDSYLVARQA